MAYYAPFYRPTYYNPMQTDAMNQFNQPIQQPINQPMAQQTNNGLVWVQGEAGAKSYIVAPGATVMLMDSEGERFFLKSADASGMPLPLRVFDYKERENTPTSDFKGCTSDSIGDGGRFVTHEELERRLASISNQCQCKNKDKKNNLTEDATDGE